MNITTTATRILCYGDSNTWGRSGQDTQRYPINVRWTGILQEQLGSNFEVIEEGLRSRTTNLNDDDPMFPGRNGLEYLRPCLESHSPLDLVVLWLGTNDLKTKFNRSAQDVAVALAELVKEIQLIAKNSKDEPSKILLISSPLVDESVLKPGSQFARAGNKSKEFASRIQQLSSDANCHYLDLSKFAHPGKFDGVHLEPESHIVVAEEMYKKVREICQ